MIDVLEMKDSALQLCDFQSKGINRAQENFCFQIGIEFSVHAASVPDARRAVKKYEAALPKTSQCLV